MTKEERVRAAVAAQAVDRVPTTFWQPFRHEPAAGEGFVRATLNFADRYELDLLKVMHETVYEMPVDMPLCASASDWANFPANPPDSGTWGERLRMLRQIVDNAPNGTPVVETVPGVYSTALKVTGGRLHEHLATDPAPVQAGLRHLAGAIANYARAAIETAGCAGVFYIATMQGPGAESVGEREYADIFLPLEQYALGGAISGWCNILYLEGHDPLSRAQTVAPLIREAHTVGGRFALAEARARFGEGKCLVGGLDADRIGVADRETIRQAVQDALTQLTQLTQTNNRGLILAPGGTLPAETSPAQLNMIREAVATAISATLKENEP